MKKAFLVVSPESCGNHLVRYLFTQAKCFGDCGKLVNGRLLVEPQRLDRLVLHNNCSLSDIIEDWDGNLVYGKSVPMSNTLPDILRFAKVFEKYDYEVNWIIPIRSFYCSLQSKKLRGHKKEATLDTLNEEYSYIFKNILIHGGRFYLCPVSLLLTKPEFVIKEINKLFHLDISLDVCKNIADADHKWRNKI